MQQRKTKKPNGIRRQRAIVRERNNPHPDRGRSTANPNPDTDPVPNDVRGDTPAELAVLTSRLELLLRKMETREENALVLTNQHHEAPPDGWISRLLNGKVAGMFSLGSNLITLAPLVGALCLSVLKGIPFPTQGASVWTLAGVLRPLLPEVAAIAVTAILIVASGGLKRKSLRMEFVTGVMVCYGVATIVYLAWLSLAFLRYDTLLSGVLMTLALGGIVSILRRAPAEVGEIREMIRVQREKEAQKEKQ